MGSDRWVVFDLGGVVVDYHHDRVLAALGEAAGLSVEGLREVLKGERLEERFGRGEICEAEFAAALGRCCGRVCSDELVREGLNVGLCGEFDEMLALITRVKSVAQVACLSNTNETHWRRARERFRCLPLFARTFASHEVGLLKPHREIFDHVWAALGRNGGPPPVLIDDLISNIEGARQAGWEAIHYRGSPKELWEELQRYLGEPARPR